MTTRKKPSSTRLRAQFSYSNGVPVITTPDKYTTATSHVAIVDSELTVDDEYGSASRYATATTMAMIEPIAARNARSSSKIRTPIMMMRRHTSMISKYHIDGR